MPHPSRSHRVGWEEQNPIRHLFFPLTILTITITLLLTPLTTVIWTHVPGLTFLQFPWRLTAIVAAVLALTLATALRSLHLIPTTTAALTLLIATAFTYPAYHLFHQPCDEEDTIQSRVALFQSNKGSEPTDEYTPTTADNDSLAPNNPPYWLGPDPNAKAPASRTSGLTPTHLTVTAPTSENLILNLRDYPAWRIALNGTPIATTDQFIATIDGYKPGQTVTLKVNRSGQTKQVTVKLANRPTKTPNGG